MSNDIKWEIMEKITEHERISKEDRHAQNNRFHKLINEIDDKMDENTKSIINLKKDSEYMKKEFEEYRKETKEWFFRIEKLLKEQSGIFATKEQHEANSKKIDMIFKVWGTIWIVALWWITTEVLQLISK